MRVDLKRVGAAVNTNMPLPAYATAGAAGMDLRACLAEPLIVHADTTILIPTGIALHIREPHVAGIILPRSGLGHKHGIVLGNLLGLIDSDYQGELQISCWNRSPVAYTIQPNERIAQLVFIPIIQATFTIVSEFTRSARGEGGFGHTGDQ